jgi:nucleotide-binding universal stress UspA family protein
MYKQMLVPVDASPTSKLGLEEAVKLAKDRQATAAAGFGASSREAMPNTSCVIRQCRCFCSAAVPKTRRPV